MLFLGNQALNFPADIFRIQPLSHLNQFRNTPGHGNNKIAFSAVAGKINIFGLFPQMPEHKIVQTLRHVFEKK